MGIARLFTHTVTLETFLGAGAYGDVYATAGSPIACFINDTTQLVRNAQGVEVVSSTTLYAPLSTSPDSPATAGQFAPGSRVTVNGRIAYVISATRRNSAGPTSAHHTAVTLT